ncbi:hypothetical protein [Blastococcus sp. CCUG 61487]|uniref:hypothetical protein n=1 Tax=Blastococcus sp. CCUG 61487 TaxID=1840703 RepID=UPI00113FC010|nr:hypothetical protein [Blastococcus sp. CCUG 61487]TKJ35151.1 hypothetical protein A6V29_14380 [Blastococcus sp. CCUG 61487]
MNAIRRTATLVGLTLAVIVGSSIPASADFRDAVTTNAALATGTVAAPTNLNVTVQCVGSELHATVSWTRSTSPRISGYAIDATINTDRMSFRAPANASSYTYRIPRLWQSHSIPVAVTVTTDTEYRWTATSPSLHRWVTTC